MTKYALRKHWLRQYKLVLHSSFMLSGSVNQYFTVFLLLWGSQKVVTLKVKY